VFLQRCLPPLVAHFFLLHSVARVLAPVCSWEIPEGGLTETMKDPLVTLSGHGKPVALLQWHPTASNVLASAAKDPSVKIWDVERATAKYTLEGFGACAALRCAVQALWLAG
jgi:hypothetical protein